MKRHAGKYIAYYRVSTDKQGVKGLGIEAQKQAVKSYLNGGSWQLVAEFIEQESGKKVERVALNQALRMCRLQGATLIVAKLDRLARNAAFLKTIVSESGERGVVFCDMPNIPAGPQGKLMIGMMAEFAEFEAGIISQRTKAALAVRKEQLAKEGKRLGTPHPHLIKRYGAKAREEARKVRMAKAASRAADYAPIIAGIQAEGIASMNGIAEELNRQGYEAPRGGAWSGMQVWRILQRVKPEAAA